MSFSVDELARIAIDLQSDIGHTDRFSRLIATLRQTLGCDAHWEAEKLTVNAAQLSSCAISDTLMREMRSSAIFLGAILARCGRAEISYPGGCEA